MHSYDIIVYLTLMFDLFLQSIEKYIILTAEEKRYVISLLRKKILQKNNFFFVKMKYVHFLHSYIKGVYVAIPLMIMPLSIFYILHLKDGGLLICTVFCQANPGIYI